MKWVLAIAAGISIAAMPALADGPAQIIPARDVDVTYQAPVPGAQNTMLLQRMRFSALLRRQRLDMPTSGHWVLRDFSQQTLSVVSDARRSVVRMPLPPQAGEMILAPGDHWVLKGKVNIAGLVCNDWQVVGANGAGDSTCLTEDGVTLRSQHGARVVMQALSVNYAIQPPGIFTIPINYAEISPR